MDLTKPAVFPCWERFADNEKRFVNDEAEYNALCSLHGKPIVYVMLAQQKQALANVDAVVNQENQKIVDEAIKNAVSKRGGQWKKPR